MGRRNLAGKEKLDGHRERVRAGPLRDARIGEAKDPPLRPFPGCDEVRAALEERLDLGPAPDEGLHARLLRFDERAWTGPGRIEAG